MGKRSREKRQSEAAAPAQSEEAPARGEAAPGRGGSARPSAGRDVGIASTPNQRGRDGEPPPTFAELWRENRTPALVLFAVAALARAVLLVQISRTPFIEVGNIDSVGYHHWATRIAGGEWWPAGTFYQSPLYAYFLAAFYAVFGPGPWAPRVVQVLLGSLNPVLLYAIGARLFSRRVGWLAGLGLALYGPVVLEEITFSKTTLLITTSLAGFALYLRGAQAGRRLEMGLAGALFGLSVVGVGQWLLPFGGLAAWAVYCAAKPQAGASRHRARRPDLFPAAAFALGGVLVILPLVLWNSAKGGGLVLTSGDAGLNFFNGNNERASGLPAPPLGVRDTPQFEEADARRLAERGSGRALSPAEVARYWSSQGLAWIRAHPGDWLALLGMKLATLWNGYEIPDNYHYTFMRTHFFSGLWGMLTFFVVAPLALVGAVMPFWRRRDATALYIACFGYLATMLIFYVRGRYRLPATPFLILFAALAVDRVWRAIEVRRWREVAALAGGLALAGAFTNREYCEPSHHGMMPICLGGDTWFDQEWLKLAEWYRNAGDLDRAVAYVERSRECERPRSVGSIDFWAGEIETMRTERALRETRASDADVSFVRAEKAYRAAIGRGFRKAQAQSNLASLYAIAGKPSEAVLEFEVAAASGRLDPAATRRFARAYVALGRCADAERVLARSDRERGLAGPSEETRSILGACGGQP